MDHFPHTMGMQMRVVGHASNNPEPQKFSVPNEQMGLVGQMPNNPRLNTLTGPNNVVGHEESPGGNMGLRPNGNQLARGGAVMMTNMIGHNISLPVKRKAEMLPMLNMSNSLSSLLHNKLSAHMAADVSPHLHSHLSPHRKTGSPQPNSPIFQGQTALNKKVASNESVAARSSLQHSRPVKKQTTQIESASKVRPEIFEAVRSKMRENLTSALALASQKRDDALKSEKDQTGVTVTHQMPASTKNSQFDSAMNGNVGSGSQELSGVAFGGTTNNTRVLSAALIPNESSMDSAQTFQEFQYSSIFPDVDVRFSDNFFDKDDLLQGNGLSWAFDFDMQKREAEEAHNADKTMAVPEEANGCKVKGEVANLNPETLAFKIEAELFKLFGGVNKKYKERGRSLLFNLKDRNNPDLREKVMSGEIPPERLCAMSAEDLASKELSEWRVSKAEEMAQMVVLPDTDGDMRRLVKKTHKGEYQVEFERDHDGIVDEVSVGKSMLTRARPKKETKTPASKASVKDEGNVLESQDFSGSLVIPTDGTDLMQGMMVDELKDTESLPPIVSLDEFMESLDSEPPFENISSDEVRKASELRAERPKIVSNSKASSQHASDSPKDASSKKTGVIKKNEIDMSAKSAKSLIQNFLSSITPEADWEGILQLNISCSVTVQGQFQSGEKTSMKEWPTTLEIKGRVRLDSFEKFLQELPMSRTRAVMVLHVTLKDSTSEKQQCDFSEAIDSYTADERLGFAEPAPGVELYLCPHTPKMIEMLSKHLPKHRLESNLPTENTLISVVVWRRAHTSSGNGNLSSPNSSSLNKNFAKKQQQQHSVPNRMQNSSNSTNVNATPTRPPPINNVDDDGDDDDIPPGFGPGVAKKDDDDLPEYNFSGDLNPSFPRTAATQNLHQGVSAVAPRPVDQVRELIKKYGQSGTGGGSAVTASDRSLGIEPWNDDDDDDIPEWRPEAILQSHHQLARPLLMHMQPPGGVPRPPPGGRWAPQLPPGMRWRPY